MSWSFGNVPNAGSGNQQSTNPELPEIQTDKIGFLAIAGDTKIRLAPRPWPSDRLPPSSASLLSIAPKAGLIAAAGADCLAIATTESVRQAYTADAPSEHNVKHFSPQATLSIPRVSQVAFSADESCLAIAAEEGGGLAIYDTQGLQQGRHEPAFQLATNGISVRALAPNPATESSHFFALVLDQGQLLLANLKERQLVNASSGSSVFREGVSCVSWSARGKQLVVGLRDGSAAQYDPKGDLKATIPCPASTSGLPMTAIYWLANDDFLTVHTPNEGDSKISVVHRDKASGGFSSQAFPIDPTTPMGPRTPTHHYINRLKGFPPSLDDALILSSSSGFDIGLITKSSAPLSEAQVANTYALTTMSDDSRRAYMPMASDGANESSALGMALDLSSTQVVQKPIPTNDLSDSVNPLPALMIFDIEGRLTTYWFVYTDSIIQNTAYPGLVNAQGQQPSSTPAPSAFGSSATPAPNAQSTPAFGASTFGQPSKPAFGAASTPGFGGASAMGAKASPWGSSQPATATAKPTFGASTTFGAAAATPAFGASTGIASKPSVWGTPSTQSSAPAFGQPSAPSSSAQSGFAAFGSSGGSGFAATNAAEKPAASPFAAFGNSNKTTTSPFATAASSNNAKSPSPFAASSASGANNAPSPFAAAAAAGGSSNTFSSPFAAAANNSGGSTFASFGQASTPGTSSSLFGSAKPAFGTPSAPTSIFGAKSSNDQQAPFSPEANMEDDTAEAAESSKPAPASLFGAGNFKVGSIFAQNRDATTASQNEPAKTEQTPAKADSSSSLFGSNFGAALGDAAAAATPATPIKEEPQSPAAGLPAVSMTPATPKVTQEPDDAPLPPDFTKTPAKTPASVQSSPAAPADAPLPPDFLDKTVKPSIEAEDAPLPPDFTASSSNWAEQPIAGSPPVDLGPESPELPGSEESLRSEESEIWEDEDAPEDDEDEHDNDEEEEEDDHDDDDADNTALQENESTTPAGAKPGISAPSTYSKTPAGLPKGPVFAPPIKESPRSPSPVREMQPTPPRPQTRKIVLPVEKYPRKTSSLSESQPPPVKEPETADLQDDEDERIKAILQAPIEPVKTLESFVAHQDYIGSDEKQGLEGQIENVYRDINSMVDTLGLNARALQAFIQGQESFSKKGGRGRSDLAEEDEWCFVELDDLDKIETDVLHGLDAGRIVEVNEKTSTISGMQHEMSRLKSRMAEMRKQLASRTDPEKRAAQRNAAMDADTEARQSQIRSIVQSVQRLLQDAEDALSVLRADLASIPASDSGLVGGSRRAVPTVEAVTKTILKMTAMVESKSGDVDVLEAQMRRLHRGLADLTLDDGSREGESASASAVGGGGDQVGLLRSSLSLRTSTSGIRRSVRGGLPSSRSMNALPTPRGIRMTATGDRTGMAGMFGSRYGNTPPHSALGKSMSVMSLASPGSGLSLGSGLGLGGGGGGGGFGQSLMSAVSRTTAGDVSGEAVVAYNVRKQHRRQVLGALKGVVEKKGSRIVRVDKASG